PIGHLPPRTGVAWSPWFQRTEAVPRTGTPRDKLGRLSPPRRALADRSADRPAVGVLAAAGPAAEALPSPARREARRCDATSRSETGHSDGLPRFRSGRQPRGTRPR